MKIKTIFAVVFSVLLLTACGDNDEHADHEGGNHDAPSEDEMRTLDVDLSVPEENVVAGESVEFNAHVTSNGDDVEDADQVMFEVLEGEDSLDMIEAEHDENGQYSIEYEFESPGEYTVISHVDAYQLHTMPEENVVVE